jgi:hypothetical protein
VARRAGKAASRKARQRNVPRAASRPAVPTTTPVPPVATPNAHEAASPADEPRRERSPAAAGSGSTLSLRERAEYHYVERDLRNIGILTALMAVLLFIAWLAFSALGLVG